MSDPRKRLNIERTAVNPAWAAAAPDADKQPVYERPVSFQEPGSRRSRAEEGSTTMPDNTQEAVAALLASADAAGLKPVVPEDETLLARVVLVVDVAKGVVPARSTSNGYEYPYEYVCVRGATALGAEAHGPTGILSVLNEGYFEDPDPDGALVDAVYDGLTQLIPPPDPSEEGPA